MVLLGDVLSKSKDWITVDPEQRYRQVSVRLWGKGVELRGELLGSEIGSPRQLRLGRGQFLISRIDARHGASGLVPGDLAGAIATNDFPAFDVDADRVDAGYFSWLSKTKAFVEMCRRASEGTTNRVRLKEERFLSERISLPDLATQRHIAAKLDGVRERIDKRRRAVEAADVEMSSLLLTVFRRIADGASYRPMQEVAPLLRRPVDIDPARNYPELGVRSFGRGIFHKPDVIGSEITWEKLFKIQQGDIVISNIKAWEGAIAVAQRQDEGRVGSHRYLTCVVNPQIATPTFVTFYLLTGEGIEKVQAASPGSADRNRTLGMDALMALTVPTPPVTQQKWFDELYERVRQVKGHRVLADTDLDALISAAVNQLISIN